jgi:hypothetical protein
MLENMYLYIHTYIYILKILKFELQKFLIVVKYFGKPNGFNWLKAEFISGCF